VIPWLPLHHWRHEALVYAALGGTFALLAALMVMGAPTGADRWLGARIQDIPWGSLGVIPRLGSEVGGGPVGFYVVPAVAAVVLAAKRMWIPLALLGAVFVLHFVLISPKLFIVAYRPSPLFGVEGAGGLESFPSGHVQWATSFYGLLAYTAVRERPSLKTPVIVAFVLIVLATMLGRIELGRHWPLDTLAGLIVGLIALRTLMHGHRFWDRRRDSAPDAERSA
jgi:undecaprenyl-diphosphatase